MTENIDPANLSLEFEIFCNSKGNPPCVNCPYKMYKNCQFAWMLYVYLRNEETVHEDKQVLKQSQLSKRAVAAIRANVGAKTDDVVTHADLARVALASYKHTKNCSRKTLEEIINYYTAYGIPFYGEIGTTNNE